MQNQPNVWYRNGKIMQSSDSPCRTSNLADFFGYLPSRDVSAVIISYFFLK